MTLTPPTDVLPERRPVYLSAAEARQLGVLDEWSGMPAEAWICDLRDLVALRRDALAWRRLCQRAELGLVLAGGAIVTGICVALLAVAVEWVR